MTPAATSAPASIARLVVLAALVALLCCRAPGGSDAPEAKGLSLSVEVSGPVVLGRPLRMRGFAANHDDRAREVRVDRSDISLLLVGRNTPQTPREVFDGYRRPARWTEKVVVPPGRKATCFDCAVPTGLHPGSRCILARGKARISWKAWVRKGDHYESTTVKSNLFEILLAEAGKRKTDFAVKGLLVELEPVRKEVTSRSQVSFLVRLRNVGDKPIRISGREKFDDNYCAFLIYAPDEQVPVAEVVRWPAKGTDGFVIPPGRAVARQFTADWGLVEIPRPGPGGHVDHERRETTFRRPGRYDVIAYFHGQDNTEQKRGWTGYARSNVVAVELKAPEKRQPAEDKHEGAGAD